jgi:hypothetical protein
MNTRPSPTETCRGRQITRCFGAKEVMMTLIGRWKPGLGWLAAAVVAATLMLGAPPSQAARVGIGINLGFPAVVAPPVVVAPPIIGPPPVVIGSPGYYAAPHRYYYAHGPRHGFYAYDRHGHRYWQR